VLGPIILSFTVVSLHSSARVSPNGSDERDSEHCSPLSEYYCTTCLDRLRKPTFFSLWQFEPSTAITRSTSRSANRLTETSTQSHCIVEKHTSSLHYDIPNIV